MKWLRMHVWFTACAGVPMASSWSPAQGYTLQEGIGFGSVADAVPGETATIESITGLSVSTGSVDSLGSFVFSERV